MTAPLSAHGHGTWRWMSVGRGSSATSFESGSPDRREQLEQLAERRDRVVGGQEAREDVAAAGRAREDHAVAGGGLGQLGQRRGRPHHLEAAADHFLDLARRRDRNDDLPATVRSS